MVVPPHVHLAGLQPLRGGVGGKRADALRRQLRAQRGLQRVGYGGRVTAVHTTQYQLVNV